MPLCWLAMQIVHEFGHILAAWVTGGRVTAVVLHPLAISRTDVSPSPNPLVVVWGGPIVGVLAPLLAWTAAKALRWRSALLWRFFAGFCLVANGAYIGSGAFNPVGDAAELIRLGGSRRSLAGFGLVTIAAGFLLWNSQGADFGIGQHPCPISPRHAWTVFGLLLMVTALELVWARATGFR